MFTFTVYLFYSKKNSIRIILKIILGKVINWFDSISTHVSFSDPTEYILCESS